MSASAGAAAGGSAPEKKQDRSRDAAAQGKETLAYFGNLNVLIAGLKGLGTEIAKNIILTGPRSVTLYDPELATISDLGLNYYLKASDVGRPRAAATVPSLRDLNEFVPVSTVDELTEAVVGAQGVVILTNSSREEQLRWNAFCRTRGIAFMAADVRGAAGYFFNDFGATPHTVKDANGENLKNAVVCAVDAAPGVTDGRTITVMTDASQGRPHGMDTGNWVVFKEVEGLTALNDGKPRKVVDAATFALTIALNAEDKTEDFAPSLYSKGGIVTQAHVPFTVAFESLEARIKAPYPSDDPTGMGCLLDPDLAKFGRSAQLHVAFQALHEFAAKHGGAMPALRNAEQAAEVVALAKAFNDQQKAAADAGAQPVDAVDEALVARVASLAAVELPGLSTFFSGVVAQEVVKLSGKFTPLRQWLYYDASEVLLAPAEEAKLAADEFAPLGGRYDNVIGLYGRTLHGKISNQKVFLVGCGALGCELLKNFILMGVGCGPDGHVTTTDMDTIELSNLSRQFLYRRRHVGSAKSTVSTAEISLLNPDFKATSRTTPVGATTEDVFTDAFWAGQDIVVNALDNVEARQYMDAKCCFFGKSMLDSGTLGTKGNTFIVKPRTTETYRDNNDGADDKDAIPMCTIRELPYLPDHCIEWARNLFQGEFAEGVRGAVALQTDAPAWLAAQREGIEQGSTDPDVLQQTITALQTARTASFETCVDYAIQLFTRHFTHKIQTVIHRNPADKVTKKEGPYWVGRRRFPVVVHFDIANPLHKDFVVHATKLAADVFGVALPADWTTDAVLAPVASAVKVPVWSPAAAAAEGDEEEEEAGAAGAAATGGAGTAAGGAAATSSGTAAAEAAKKRAEALLSKIETEILPALASTGATGKAAAALAPLSFEKDDDSNHHVDFMTAAANLRADNFRIARSDRDVVRVTAGRIIPAVATTTTMVTGLVAIELAKAVADAPLDSIRNAYINLATNAYSICEPAGPKRKKSAVDRKTGTQLSRAIPEGFTAWDYIEVTGNPGITAVEVGELLAAAPYGVKLTRVIAPISAKEEKVLYTIFAKNKGERGAKPLRDLVGEVAGADHAVKAHQQYLILKLGVQLPDNKDLPVVVPALRVKLTA